MLMPNDGKPNRSQFIKCPLYDRMTKVLHLTGKAQQTVYGYLRTVRQLADHCRKAPFHPLALDEMALNRLAFAARSKTGSEPAGLIRASYRIRNCAWGPLQNTQHPECQKFENPYQNS